MRRRRARFTWLPIEPNFPEGTTSAGQTWYETFLSPSGLQAGGRSAVDISFLVADRTQQNVGGSGIITGPGPADGAEQVQIASLRDLTEGQDYVVERIVGKVWGQAGQFTIDAEERTAVRMMLKAGIAVIPMDDDASPGLETESMSLMLANNVQQSWMWQRSWILNNNAELDSSNTQVIGPTSTHEYGSVMEGGHVDVKSVRRITRDQRLVFIFEAVTLDTTIQDTGDVVIDGRIDCGYDLRILGAMRKGRHKSTFA